MPAIIEPINVNQFFEDGGSFIVAGYVDLVRVRVKI